MTLNRASFTLMAGLLMSFSAFGANYRSLTIPPFEGTITSDLPGYEIVSATIHPEWPYDDRNALEKLIWYGTYAKAKTLTEIPLAIANDGTKMSFIVPELKIDSEEWFLTGKKSTSFRLDTTLTFRHPDGSLLQVTIHPYVHQESEAADLESFQYMLGSLTINETYVNPNNPAIIGTPSVPGKRGWSSNLSIVEASPTRLKFQEKFRKDYEDWVRENREPEQTDLFETEPPVKSCQDAVKPNP